MFSLKKTKILQNQNALELIPAAKHKHIYGDNNLIILQIPKFKNEKFARWFIPKRKSIYYSIKLDELGTKVYELIDGRRNIDEICSIINSQKTIPIDDIEQRAIKFLTNLFKYRFITFEQLSNNTNAYRR